MTQSPPSASDDADALNAAGRAALAGGDAERAIAIFAQAILAAPLDPHVHVNMAAAYLALDRLGEANAHASRAVKLAPAMPEAHHNLGNALFASGDADGALAAFARARALDPDSEAHWTNLLFAQTFAEPSSEIGTGRSAIFAENKAWGTRIERRLGPVERPGVTNADPERPLNLGYLLPEFDAHVTARFIVPILAAHTRGDYRLSLYAHCSGGGAWPSVLTPPGVCGVDTFGLNDAEIAERMRADGIDVLIHPCTFKARYRTVLAQRCAPLQIAGINFVSTTGLAATDYMLCDAVLAPPGDSEAFFTERLLRLPQFNCYGVPAHGPPVAPLPAFANRFVRFGSLNNPAKLGDATIAVWAGALARVSASRLLLKHRAFEDADVRERTARRFAAHGIVADRIDFAGFTADPGDYLAAYNEIDIALDPTNFNGGTTSYEAIWMGVPVLTLTGESVMGRQTASLMTAVGHPEFVTNSKQAFVDKAFALTHDIVGLAAIRVGLRHKAAVTIFDSAGYTRQLEAVVRWAWRDLCHARA